MRKPKVLVLTTWLFSCTVFAVCQETAPVQTVQGPVASSTSVQSTVTEANTNVVKLREEIRKLTAAVMSQDSSIQNMYAAKPKLRPDASCNEMATYSRYLSEWQSELKAAQVRRDKLFKELNSKTAELRVAEGKLGNLQPKPRAD